MGKSVILSALNQSWGTIITCPERVAMSPSWASSLHYTHVNCSATAIDAHATACSFFPFSITYTDYSSPTGCFDLFIFASFFSLISQFLFFFRTKVENVISFSNMFVVETSYLKWANNDVTKHVIKCWNLAGSNPGYCWLHFANFRQSLSISEDSDSDCCKKKGCADWRWRNHWR